MDLRDLRSTLTTNWAAAVDRREQAVLDYLAPAIERFDRLDAALSAIEARDDLSDVGRARAREGAVQAAWRDLQTWRCTPRAAATALGGRRREILGDIPAPPQTSVEFHEQAAVREHLRSLAPAQQIEVLAAAYQSRDRRVLAAVTHDPLASTAPVVPPAIVQQAEQAVIGDQLADDEHRLGWLQAIDGAAERYFAAQGVEQPAA